MLSRIPLLISACFLVVSSTSNAAVSLSAIITGVGPGTASASYSSVIVGTPVTFSFDIPDNAGLGIFLTDGYGFTGGGIYPLAATISGLPAPGPGGFGLTILSPVSLGGQASGVDRVTLNGSVGDVGSLSAVFIKSLDFQDPSGTALQGAGLLPSNGLPSFAETALEARKFREGQIVFLDNVGTGQIAHTWGYSFQLIPEPSSVGFMFLAPMLLLRRNRRA